ncbi:DUF971 domain-containing protein [Nitrosovibrio sp. Nv17]|jgi:DUF971 family protein|uniref:DUF971 domain-containing protein n=1 Tax=Nitrosovibrio sp. Nv17 TaxID=1855339 RepID=UPI0009085E0A|nr:DUF971 domain-containing protein [Nitrosovibrio sp. Nv17]SFW13629.1 DUF971 family protein [Nitrosovibrio sp. Nv17]
MHARTLSLQRLSGIMEITWQDGERQRITHAFLRSRCRCTRCLAVELRGESVAAPPEGLRIIDIQPVGAYGIQISFSDGHDRGVYPWAYLRELASLPEADP